MEEIGTILNRNFSTENKRIEKLEKKNKGRNGKIYRILESITWLIGTDDAQIVATYIQPDLYIAKEGHFTDDHIKDMDEFFEIIKKNSENYNEENVEKYFEKVQKLTEYKINYEKITVDKFWEILDVAIDHANTISCAFQNSKLHYMKYHYINAKIIYLDNIKGSYKIKNTEKYGRKRVIYEDTHAICTIIHHLCNNGKDGKKIFLVANKPVCAMCKIFVDCCNLTGSNFVINASSSHIPAAWFYPKEEKILYYMRMIKQRLKKLFDEEKIDLYVL